LSNPFKLTNYGLIIFKSGGLFFVNFLNSLAIFADGSINVCFADGSINVCFADGSINVCFADGSINVCFLSSAFLVIAEFFDGILFVLISIFLRTV